MRGVATHRQPRARRQERHYPRKFERVEVSCETKAKAALGMQEVVRHSRASTTADIYLHKTNEQRRDAIRRRDERIAATGGALASQPIRICTEGSQRQAV